MNEHWPAPLTELSPTERRRIRLILSDLDDTITTAGRVPEDSFASLWRLHDGGLPVVIVTGRPAGWCDHLARMWPVAGVVGENGALWMRYNRQLGRMERSLPAKREVIRVQQSLARLGREITGLIPECRIAADQPFRLFDLAIDIAEDVAPLSAPRVMEICQIAQRSGATCKVSSIHVNCWFGAHTKLTGVRNLVAHLQNQDALPRGDRAVFPKGTLYVGDSPNDEPMFADIPTSVGVANVQPHLAGMKNRPAYITRAAGAAGFCELVAFLLS